MNLSGTRVGASAKSASAGNTDLQGRWLLFARTVWVIVVVLTLGLFVVSIPSYFAYLHILSATPTDDIGAQLARQDVQQLQAEPMSLTQKHISRYLAQPAILRDPKVRSLLREVCHEVKTSSGEKS